MQLKLLENLTMYVSRKALCKCIQAEKPFAEHNYFKGVLWEIYDHWTLFMFSSKLPIHN